MRSSKTKRGSTVHIPKVRCTSIRVWRIISVQLILGLICKIQLASCPVMQFSVNKLDPKQAGITSWNFVTDQILFISYTCFHQKYSPTSRKRGTKRTKTIIFPNLMYRRSTNNQPSNFLSWRKATIWHTHKAYTDNKARIYCLQTRRYRKREF